MQFLSRVRYAELNWGLLLGALVLTAIGLAFVASATMDPSSSGFWSRQAHLQLLWWCLGLTACFTCVHVPLETWRRLAIPALIAVLLIQTVMLALRGTPLVPTIKGAHNWLALGPARLQPSEFYKIAALLVTARMLADPGTDTRRLGWCVAIASIGCLPALLIATEDLGSALTFGPMVVGMLFLAGMPFRFLMLGLALLVGVISIGIMNLDEQGYWWKRICAFLDPEAYSRTEGFQTMRCLRSIGSGQLTGKGFAQGDQNLLGWLPEKHTDMIFAVIGEETGFVGSVLVLLAVLGFAILGLVAAMRCRVPFGRYLLGGFICLVMGQVTINLLVVTGMMPVTGITLPFFSYGGSSLLAIYILLGICLSATSARTRQLGRTRYTF